MKKPHALLKTLGVLVFVLSFSATGCLPTSNFATSTVVSDDDSGDYTSDDDEDEVKAPCTSYDTTNPSRAICVSCYTSVLEARCPGADDFSACADTSVLSTYVSQINQCISQSIIAGFTCSLTCPTGQVVNASTCRCVPTPSGGSGGGGGNVDVGQNNHGPPIVNLSWPTIQDGEDAGGSCSGVFPLFMSVQNRGNTVFGLNTYSSPDITNSSTSSMTSTIGPRAMTPSEMAAAPGTNVYGRLSYETSGSAQLGSSYEGRPSKLRTLAGADSDGVSFNSDGVEATSATLLNPSFTARDEEGNIYLTDSRANTVNVICNQAVGTFHCTGVTQGHIKRLAGGSDGVAGPSANNVAALATAKLNAPHGIAVDQHHNVFVADSGNHVVRVICAGTSGVCATRAAGNIYTVAGTNNTSGSSTNHLNYPYGIDLDPSTADTTVWIADYQNHSIRHCTLNNGNGYVCTNAIITGVGNSNGTAGFKADGAATTNEAWMRFPTDIKVTAGGNAVFADYGNHLVRVYCLNVSDICTTTGVLTLAGRIGTSNTPSPGNAASGVAGTVAALTRPYTIALAKRYGDDGAAAQFSDNNVAFSERMFAPSLFNGVFSAKTLAGVSSPSDFGLGQSHTCMVTLTGAVQCLGDNAYSQMGNGSLAGGTQSNPVNVSTMGSGNTFIGFGSNHTCATNGSAANLKCWGDNNYGQLGAGNILPQSTPVSPNTSGTNGVFAWITGGDRHTCVEDFVSHSIYCWGDNAYGQLGDGTTTARNALASGTPVSNMPIANTVLTRGLASGRNHTCTAVVRNDTHQAVYCWGGNNAGQLGNGTTTNALTRVNPLAFSATTYSYLSAGGDHTCVIDSGAGVVRCWGSNSYGESGQADMSVNFNTPQAVTLPVGFTPSSLGVGIRHSCASNSLGTKVYCWGANDYGQLGNDDVEKSAAPMEVPLVLGTATISYVRAGGHSTCARLSNGTVQCWGDNRYFQIGSSTTVASSGNAIRIVCGDNTADPTREGYCQGLTAGAIYRLGGVPGKAGNGNQDENNLGTSAQFASLQGISYDLYKNIVLTSGGFMEKNGTTHKDYSVRLISREVTSDLMTSKFMFTDSNSQTSAYCLRVKAATQCNSQGICSCRLAAPTDEQVNPNFWSAIPANNTCQ